MQWNEVAKMLNKELSRRQAIVLLCTDMLILEIHIEVLLIRRGEGIEWVTVFPLPYR